MLKVNGADKVEVDATTIASTTGFNVTETAGVVVIDFPSITNFHGSIIGSNISGSCIINGQVCCGSASAVPTQKSFDHGGIDSVEVQGSATVVCKVPVESMSVYGSGTIVGTCNVDEIEASVTGSGTISTCRTSSRGGEGSQSRGAEAFTVRTAHTT